MGKLSLFQISFAENRTVYFPGDMLRGQLNVQLKSPMGMKAIKLKFVGTAHVHWSESEGSGDQQRTVHYSATESLFEQMMVLYGKGSATTNDKRTLSQGLHSFPFNFQLPDNLPSSYEDHIGHIRYFIKATINKPWKFDHSTKTVFTILDMVDLNTLPNMLTPSGASGSKTLCCWFCSSGPIELEFHLDRTGYVPGEWIAVNATVTNSSNSHVLRTSAKLKQLVTYHAVSKSRCEVKTLATALGGGCGPHDSISWSNERIQIPPVPPSDPAGNHAAHCCIIDISYAILFKVHLRTCAVDMNATAPITIGTIPLRSLGIYPNQLTGVADQPGCMTPTAPPPATFSSATNDGPIVAPPPSYTAAAGAAFDTRDTDDNKYTMGNTNYAPQYTYYDWNQPAFSYK